MFLKILAPEGKFREINGSAAMLCYLEPLDQIEISSAKKNELQNLFIGSLEIQELINQNGLKYQKSLEVKR